MFYAQMEYTRASANSISSSEEQSISSGQFSNSRSCSSSSETMDTLVQNLPSERPSFVRGFRKNLGGRWRRLVKRKPSNDMCGHIPAELKPQLKQIYVY